MLWLLPLVPYIAGSGAAIYLGKKVSDYVFNQAALAKGREILANSKLKLNDNQLTNAGIIYTMATDRKVPDRHAKAMITNSYTESRLGDFKDSGFAGEESFGLFQVNINAKDGPGYGMSRSELLNPYTNLLTIMRDRNFGQFLLQGGSIPELAVYFGVNVERPQNKQQVVFERSGHANSLFPKG